MINENSAYISSYAANTSLDIDDNEIEVCPFGHKAITTKVKQREGGSQR